MKTLQCQWNHLWQAERSARGLPVTAGGHLSLHFWFCLAEEQLGEEGCDSTFFESQPPSTQSGRLDSNQRPFDPQSNALPDCATARK